MSTRYLIGVDRDGRPVVRRRLTAREVRAIVELLVHALALIGCALGSAALPDPLPPGVATALVLVAASIAVSFTRSCIHLEHP